MACRLCQNAWAGRISRRHFVDGKPGTDLVFDGYWLQGFANVQRIHLEEYGWLFRTYAAELGDGILLWNHNVIARNRVHYDENFPVKYPATDRRLYDDFRTSVVGLALMACSLKTQRFLPEILAINLAVEATGVGGYYIAESYTCCMRLGDPLAGDKDIAWH